MGDITHIWSILIPFKQCWVFRYVEEGVEEIDEITQAEGEAQAEREEAMHVTGDTPPEELPLPTPEQPTTGKEVKTVPVSNCHLQNWFLSELNI